VFNLNKVVLIGRLTSDPNLKFVPGSGTAVTTVNVAVDRKMKNKDGQKEADFINVVIWGKQAENVANFLGKGRLIGIAGRIQVRSYDKDGTRVYITEVVAEEVQFLDKGNSGQTGTGQASGGFDDMQPVDDGDIPF
jgi:single-strand DNA-binding protein